MKHKIRYKIGDRVRIKTLEKLRREYKFHGAGKKPYLKCFDANYVFPIELEKRINEECPDRIVTIIEIHDSLHNQEYCYMKEVYWCWQDWMIEGLYKEPIFEPIYSRFEILDI